MYSVSVYGQMIADSIRTDAYARALKAAVFPGCIVLEIGTGATALFAMLACRYGARRVYAVEPDESVVLAREIARANGLADDIEFIQAFSPRIELAEKADLVISILRGTLPFFRNHVPILAYAR